MAQKPGLIAGHIPGNTAVLLEHDIVEGEEKRNILRKAGKLGLDLRDFCVLQEGLLTSYYTGDRELTNSVDPGEECEVTLVESNQWQVWHSGVHETKLKPTDRFTDHGCL